MNISERIDDALIKWDSFIWNEFRTSKWPGFFVLFDWVQQWLTCKLGLCDECPHCTTYVCWSCMRRVPWDFGAADEMPDVCDDCYCEAHEDGRYGQ